MQIFIKESTSKEDWYIIDLQGRLEHTGDLNDEILGTLTKKPNTKDDFTFTIGNSLLNGKRAPLKKPLLVLKKNKLNNHNEDDDNSSRNKEELNDQVEYTIEGIAYDKITFATRPTTIIPQSSVVYGSPTHKSPTNSPTNNNKSTTPTSSSPIKQPEFN